MPDAAAAIPSGADRATAALQAAGPGRLPAMPAAAPARSSLCFARTEAGDQQVRHNQPVLPLHVSRLLLLFEGPQTVEDLRRMIDEPWLPEALIELERRRLIQRITMQMPRTALPQDCALPQDRALPPAQPFPQPAALRQRTGDAALDRRRAMTRILFLRQLGSLGSDMARRIDRCGSDHELDELMPQVDALIEAIAGHEALGRFRRQTTRGS